jgi:tetratricopeptide (TPR) repeat protein
MSSMTVRSDNVEHELARLAAGTMRADEMLQASSRLMAVADGAHWSQAASFHAKALYALGRVAEALAMFECAWRRADQLDAPDAAALAAILGGTCCMSLYDYAHAEEWFTREYELTRSLGSNLRRSLTDFLAGARLSQGNLAGAHEVLAEFEGAASAHALLAFHEGAWERAVLLMRNRLDAARAAGMLVEVGNCASVLGRFARIGNLRTEAELYLGEALTASLAYPDLNRELFTRVELAVFHAELGRFPLAKEQLVRCQEILDDGEDWRGHRGAVALTFSLVEAAECIARVRGPELVWTLASERLRPIKLPDTVSEGFSAAIEIFRRHHAPWEEVQALAAWSQVLLAAGHHRLSREKFNLAFAVCDSVAAPVQLIDRIQAEMFRFIGISNRLSSNSPTPVPGSHLFRKEGEYWTISFEGSILRLRHTIGMHYVSLLVANPGKEFSAQDLAASASRPSVKPRGRKKLEFRIDNQRAKDDFDDRDNAARERARQMVTKRIKDVIAKIRVTHPELARHFATHIRTGYTCAYIGDDGHSGWAT